MNALALTVALLGMAGAPGPDDRPFVEYSIHLSLRIAPWVAGDAGHLERLGIARELRLRGRPTGNGSVGVRIGVFETLYLEYRRGFEGYSLVFDGLELRDAPHVDLDDDTHQFLATLHPLSGSYRPFGVTVGGGVGRLTDADDRGFDTRHLRYGLVADVSASTGEPADELGFSFGVQVALVVQHTFFADGPPAVDASGTLHSVMVYFDLAIGLVSYAPPAVRD